MVLRLNIDQIEPATRDWICKVQIVEISRPRESLDKKCTFQNLILEDEKYAAKLRLLNTYLISTARAKLSPTSYGKPIHQFYWILDKETVIEQIKPSNEVENPLPPPTKLNITGFDRIPDLMVDSAAEIGISFLPTITTLKYTSALLQNTYNLSFCIIYTDILAIVLRCGPQKHAGRSHHRCRELTLCDNQCSFQIDLIDATATTTASITAELGEKLLSMTAEDIFDITCTKRQSLSLNHVHEMLSDKLFDIQLRKSSWGSSNTTHATLSVLSYMEKPHTPQSTTDRTSKKIKPLEISEVRIMPTTTAATCSNPLPEFEPPTPTKKV
uniref:Uncharacterized protein n=1 Tax=Solanum tuberosum TaxID=4113 RepID=M1BZ49_SOLTU